MGIAQFTDCVSDNHQALESWLGEYAAQDLLGDSEKECPRLDQFIGFERDSLNGRGLSH